MELPLARLPFQGTLASSLVTGHEPPGLNVSPPCSSTKNLLLDNQLCFQNSSGITVSKENIERSI